MIANKEKIGLLVRCLVGSALMGCLIIKIDMSTIRDMFLVEMVPYTILGATSIIFSLSIIQAMRIHVLLRKYSINFFNTVNFTLISSFLGTFIPGNAGADVIRALYLKRKSKLEWKDTVTLILADRLCGLLVLMLVCIITVILFWDKIGYEIREMLTGVLGDIPTLPYVEVSAIGGTLVFLILLLKIQSIRLYFAGNNVFLSIISVLPSLLFLIVLYHFARALSIYCFLIALDSSLSIIKIFFCISVTAIISLIPISVSALGVREGALVMTMSMFDVSVGTGLSVAIAYRLFSTVPILVGGLHYLVFSDRLTFENTD